MQESAKKTFLGLNEDENGPYDIVILPIPYEIQQVIEREQNLVLKHALMQVHKLNYMMKC